MGIAKIFMTTFKHKIELQIIGVAKAVTKNIDNSQQAKPKAKAVFAIKLNFGWPLVRDVEFVVIGVTKDGSNAEHSMLLGYLSRALPESEFLMGFPASKLALRVFHFF